MENRKIICDGCGRDITYTGNSIDYRLALTNQRIGKDPKYNTVTDMMMYPPIEHDMHFCDIECLLKKFHKK